MPTDLVLSWQSRDDDKDPLTYDLYFGTKFPPPVAGRNLTASTYDPGTLVEGTRHYWSVDVTDGISTTVGPTWRFRTAEELVKVYLPLILRQWP